MWSETTRKIHAFEVEYIKKLCKKWDDRYLSSLVVQQFEVDNAHTIRNASSVHGKMRVVNSELVKDDDGAIVDVILYETAAGEFGELELNRVDTKPLMLKSKMLE